MAVNRKNLLILSLALIVTPHIATAKLDKNTVAEINGKKISEKEFERRYNENIKYFRFTPPTKLNVLNDIIKFELGVQEAKKLGLDKQPEIQERMNTVLYQALVDKMLADRFRKIEVTDKEVQEFCKRYPEVRTSHVYIPLQVNSLKDAEKRARRKAQNALAALKKGKPFEEVVAEYSDGYAISTGGDVGYQLKDKLDPTYYAAALNLDIGEYTQEIVRSQYGLHIIKLTGKRSCSDINIPDWKRMIYDEKRAKLFNDYLAKLRAKAKVDINFSLLKE